jgi:hypothetical protein
MKKLIPLAAAVIALAGCSHASTPSTTEDSGVSRCRQIAANLADTKTHKVPTKAAIKQVHDDFNGSRYDDLKAAGVNYADAAQALIYGTGKGKGNPVDAAERQGLLAASCQAHGVSFPAEATPTFSLAPEPTFTPVPYAPVPTD